MAMPTTRRRHPVTETPEVSEALHAAARRWPEDRDKPSRLLRHLIDEGLKSIEPGVAERREVRLDALRRISGSYTGMYEPGYLDDLRAGWPD